jgi:MFS family permease
MGWVYTAFLIVYTIGMLPGGWLIDVIGSGRTMTLFGLTMGISVALTGALGWLSTTSEELWIGLLLIRSIAGACNAPLHPGAAHVVSDLMPRHRRATANGTVTAGALIGIAGCYPLFGWLIDRLGWPMAFVASGSALAAYSLIWTIFASRSLPAPIANASASTHGANGSAAWATLRHASLWLLTLSYAGYSYFQYLFFYWMNFYFEHVLHVPDVESRQASFYIMLAQGAGMIVGGAQHRRDLPNPRHDCRTPDDCDHRHGARGVLRPDGRERHRLLECGDLPGPVDGRAGNVRGGFLDNGHRYRQGFPRFLGRVHEYRG